MTSPIETNNVVERLRADADFLDLIPGIHPSRAARVRDAADEIERLRSERQSLSDRIDVLEGAVRLAVAHLTNAADFAQGLGWLAVASEKLEIAAEVRASLTQGGKTNG